MKLAKMFVEAGAAGIHIEDQSRTFLPHPKRFVVLSEISLCVQRARRNVDTWVAKHVSNSHPQPFHFWFTIDGLPEAMAG